MSTAVIDTIESPTVADLLEKLGSVPANRVRLRPPPGQATERDVLQIHAQTKRLCELIDGVLVEKPMGLRRSFLAMYIGHLLWVFVMPRRLGIITGEAGMMRLESGRCACRMSRSFPGRNFRIGEFRQSQFPTCIRISPLRS